MALVLGSTIAKGGIFELPEFEAAFQPWWDSLQDYLMYATIIIGKPKITYKKIGIVKERIIF